ncbi:TorF family putative porin [Pseudoduganella armeniaca]|uniref:Uncharacterized protein n=1 Tax=Pseudoduganella armeniaca TaxID=2072590 RepID=A0A2R4C6H4_9BURK|nr:TorF family putative porin [Pseudoduganella armeniaca]AVR95216.1 hypothetical protein C9I28_05380 [Pseudoduganella armeniaca]
MKRLISGVVTSLLLTTSYAQDGAVSFNAAATSDYRYRGISQTRLRPALQGGVDWTDSASGVYAGAWASTIRWTRDAGGDGGVELDLYAGQRGTLAHGVSYDVGVLGYAYPSNGLAPNADTLELYSQLGYGPVSVKYSHALTNLFGFAGSRHSGYLDASATQDLGAGWTLNLHAGRQRVRQHAVSSYTDWKVGVTKEVAGATVALAYVGTNADKAAYASPVNGKFTGRDALQLTVSKVF